MKGKMLLTLMGALTMASFSWSQMTLGHLDDFEDGTTQDWGGGPSPYGPVNFSTGGPAGAGDSFLKVTSNGATSGSGSRLATYNGFQWAGNYSAVGVTVLEVDLKNFGTEDLLIRSVMFGPEGTRFATSDAFAVPLPADGQWRRVALFLTGQAMLPYLGTETFAEMATNNQLMLIRHQSEAGPNGTPASGALGFDNIRATDHATIMPSSVTTIQGFDFSGDLSSLFYSDDNRFEILSDDTSLQGEIQIDGVSPLANGAALAFEIESLAQRPGLSISVRLRNWLTNSYNELGGGVAPTSDAGLEVVASSNLARFIQATTKAMRASIAWSPINDEDPSQDGWILSLDLAVWKIYP